MDPVMEDGLHLTRRQFFGRGATALGTAALATLLGSPARAGGSGRSAPHFAPRVKRVIYLFQNGAPSQVDLFDDKPGLHKRRDTPLPPSVRGNQRLTTMTKGKKTNVLPAEWEFRSYGRCGMRLSSLLPHTGSIADDLCLLRAVHTEAINHAPAITFSLTGAEQPGRPSFGAWLSYGLGSASRDLPEFCVMTSRDKEASCGQIFYDWYWGSGFLPTVHQGVKFRGSGDPVLYLSNPDGVDRTLRRGLLDDLAELNHLRRREVGDPEITTRIAQYEMAYRMQASVPELTDLSNEPKHVLDLYGPDVTRRGSYAHNCLLARRLAEKGVRFIQLMHAGWDHHMVLPTQMPIQCRDTDQPSAGLVKDLKQRGLLEDTLVVWGSEFGRTVFAQGDMNNPKSHGRDHHPRNFATWLAGGGVRGGLTHGETDDFSYNIVRDGVHVHDLNATILAQLGIDHERLTFRFQGRDFRLTDVHGRVVREILA